MIETKRVALAAAILLAGMAGAAAQTADPATPRTPDAAPRSGLPEATPPEIPAPGDGRPAPGSGGVVAPPRTGDTEMVKPPPADDAARTPVIVPPAAPPPVPAEPPAPAQR